MVILVVDDDPVSLLLSQHILNAGDYEVVTAVSVADAIETMRADGGSISCIVCDYLMPDATGLDLLESLTHGEQPCPPFVLLTGVSEANELDDPRVDLPAAYLTKPVQSDELLEVIAKVLAPAESTSEAL